MVVWRSQSSSYSYRLQDSPTYFVCGGGVRICLINPKFHIDSMDVGSENGMNKEFGVVCLGSSSMSVSFYAHQQNDRKLNVHDLCALDFRRSRWSRGRQIFHFWMFATTSSVFVVHATYSITHSLLSHKWRQRVSSTLLVWWWVNNYESVDFTRKMRQDERFFDWQQLTRSHVSNWVKWSADNFLCSRLILQCGCATISSVRKYASIYLRSGFHQFQDVKHARRGRLIVFWLWVC